MIHFDKSILNNGLKVILHQDGTTPLVAVNIMYDVGAKDENPEKTGFAHLFEHLMFGGSLNIPKYDEPLQKAGGENNAFTTSDLTNYYCTLPPQNIETAFWLESDRMLSLAFTPKSLEVQRNVVTEEFRQVYLNQPYGDAWLLLRPMAYNKHPYRWPTIGKKVAHIQKASMNDVKSFYNKFYNPDNAVLVVSGNINPEKTLPLIEKWFGTIKNNSKKNKRNIPVEPEQKTARKKTVNRNVPLDAIYKAFHMCSRKDERYYASDLISDILSNGNSSRLNQTLIKKKKLFSDIDAYITGDIDNGLFVLSGKLVKGVNMKDAEAAINEEIDKITQNKVPERELKKVQNKIESNLEFSDMSILNRSINLAFFELLGDANMVNQQIDHYNAVTLDDIINTSREIFRNTNCSTLYYYSNNS